MTYKRSVCVDFDGTLTPSAKPFVAAALIEEEPTPGAVEWFNSLVKAGMFVTVYTCRANNPEGAAAIRDWLLAKGFLVSSCVWIAASKPHCDVYVDDKAWRFDGKNFPSIEQINRLIPWYKEQRLAERVQRAFTPGAEWVHSRKTKEFANKIDEKLADRVARYGDAWRTSDVSGMLSHLKDEVRELEEQLMFALAAAERDPLVAVDEGPICAEAVDVAAMAYLLWMRFSR